MKAKEDSYKRLSQIISKGTYQQIADQLTKEGYRTPQGKRWTKQSIATWAFTQRKNSKNYAGTTKKRPAAIKQLSAIKKLSIIKQIVMGLHQ